MRKIIRVKNIDCPVCAGKLEKAVKKIDGVISASVNFVAGRLDVEYDENKPVLQEIKKVAYDLEPDWELIGL